MRTAQLHEGWTLELARGGHGAPSTLAGTTVPATVPGSVHTDLLTADLIPDPYLDRNELELSWIGRSDWTYRTTFRVDGPATERVDLVCAGLDTVARVTINGNVVGETANMHRSYRFDLRASVRDGDNDLVVTFASPYGYTDQRIAELGARPAAVDEPINMIRKMACNYGWDWGPTLVTSGIWRPIGVDRWNDARLSRVRPLVDVDADGTGHVQVFVDVERSGVGDDGELLLVAEVGGVTASGTVESGSTSAVLHLSVPTVARWWPHGHGDQPLYDLAVRLTAQSGGAATELDSWTRRIGFRTITIDTSPLPDGSRFALVVNGRQIFARGADWIPDDCFPTRVDRARYRTRIRQATDANIDFLRVWGGGLYENEDFYDACDEAGVLVWQDFLFACAAYPEEEPFASEVAAEARENVARLMPHASLAVWNGNNENVWGWYDWGWQDRLGDLSWGKTFYYEVLPRIVAEVDPGRPYVPGSPSSATFEQHPNDDSDGVVHEWEVWNRVDYTHYRDRHPRFVSEFGFQAPATYATIRRTVSDPVLVPDSPTMLHHQKAEGGQDKLASGMKTHLPAPRSGEHEFDDWLWLTQLNQARAMAFGIEHFRSLSPACAGTVVWQLNDCWPVTSWAAIDGDGRRKPLWYAMKRAYADRLLTVQPRGGELAVVAVNDTDEPWSGTVELQRRGLDGSVLDRVGQPLSVPARSTGAVDVPGGLAVAGDPATELLTAEIGGTRALWVWAEDIALALPEPVVDAGVEAVAGGYRVRVTARTFVRDVALFVDRLHPDAEVDDMIVTLFPGETAEFVVTSPVPLDEAALASAPVLRSVADQGVGVRAGSS